MVVESEGGCRDWNLCGEVLRVLWESIAWKDVSGKVGCGAVAVGVEVVVVAVGKNVRVVDVVHTIADRKKVEGRRRESELLAECAIKVTGGCGCGCGGKGTQCDCIGSGG